jgi:hypothetical protein
VEMPLLPGVHGDVDDQAVAEERQTRRVRIKVAEGPDSQLTTTSVCPGRALEPAATEMIR